MHIETALVSEPKLEPLTIAEAKQHCAISQDDENAVLYRYIIAARMAAEQYLGRGLYTQTRKVQAPDFADVIYLPYAAPLQNDSGASPSTAPVVQYYDTNGTLQTLASSYYTVDTTSLPGRIVRAPNQSWPAVQSDRLVTVIVTYVCGWTSVEAIPELIKQGMRLHIAAADADRVGGTEEAKAGRKAAQSMWNLYGRVFWMDPEPCLG